MKTPGTKRATKSLFALASLLLGLSLLSLAVMSCGASDPPLDTALTTPPSETGPDSYEIVSFTTDDGVALSGRLYGTGTRAVLLAHMYPADQTSWHAQALSLSAQGYLVLTFDFRGYGQSEGDKDVRYLDRDVSAGAMYLRSAGADEVVLVGASMGGTASLKAAAQLQTLSSVRIAGVATFSAPVEFMGLSASAAVPDIVLPMLLVAAQDDEGAEGARALEDLSSAHGDLEILPGGDHGTDLFSGSQAEQAESLLLDFLQRCMPVAG
jgi:alpha/beta superfamily hydrolase